MLQTLFCRMTCSSTFQNILGLMYCNAFSTTFTAVRCFQLRKKVLRLDAISYQSSDRTVQHLCLWLQNEHEGSSTKNLRLTQRGPTTMMLMPVNQITSQCKMKLSQIYYPWTILQLWNFCHSFLPWIGSFFLIITFCSAIHVYTDRFADMGIIVIRPRWLRCEFLAELSLVLIFWS